MKTKLQDMGKKKKNRGEIQPVTFNKDFIIRQARPYDYNDLCDLSESVAERNRDEIDWCHSYVGISQVDGQIVWGYVFSNTTVSPEEMNGGYDMDASPRELIDIFVRKEEKEVIRSLQYHFWRYCGMNGDAIYVWMPIRNSTEHKSLFFKKLLFDEDEFECKSGCKSVYWGFLYWGFSSSILRFLE